MKKRIFSLFAVCLVFLLATPVYAALPEGTGMITSCSAVSGSEFSPDPAIAAKLDKMFAGDIGLYKDKNKTQLVNAALGTSNVPNNGVWQYWGPEPRAGTSCFAYANAFYCTFYDGVYPHHQINSNHVKVTATGKISYANFVKWGVRDDAAVYIREGNHSIIVLHYDENYITYVDGNGNARGLIAIRKEAWQRGSGANMYNQKPSLIVQPTTAYFPAGSMGKLPCTEGGTYHAWNQGNIVQAATCKDAGLKVYTCTACGKTKEEAISKVSHMFGAWSVTEEATCSKIGTKTSVCQVCGVEKSESVEKIGHSYGKYVTVQEATIFSAGVQEKTCSGCGKVKKMKTDCVFREETLGITLTAQEGVFPENTEISVTAPEEGTVEHNAIGQALQGVTGKFFPYVWDIRVQEENVTPKGKVVLEIAIPAGFGNNLALYAVAEDTAQILDCTIDLENKAITLELETLPMLALCDLDVPWERSPAERVAQPVTELAAQGTAIVIKEIEQTQKRNDPYILLIAAAAILFVVCIVAVTVVIVKKRKKTEIPEELPEEVYL